MGQRVVKKYSICFKRQVISELESGRFASMDEARRHYEIGGVDTIRQWLRKFGRNDLLPRVVRVEKPDEADRIKQLQRRVAQLEQALGRTQAQKLLGDEYLKLACAQLGQDVESFTKKCDGRRCTGPSPQD